MKRSRLSYDEWNGSILKKDLCIKRIEDTFFNGYIGKVDIIDVSTPQIWKFNGEDIVVCQNGYKWLSILPRDEYYCITAMMNNDNQILLWYIDMIAGQGVDNDGIPAFDDLFLDLVVYPDGSIIEDDRDELEDALSENDITEEQYRLANDTCERLRSSLLSNIEDFIKYTEKCKQYFENWVEV